MSSVITKDDEMVACNRHHCSSGADRCEVIDAVSHGLHQVAQPLTVLHGVLELAVIEPRTEDEYKRSLKRAMDQWQRVIDSVASIRQLLHARPCPRSTENGAGAAATENHETIEAMRGCARV